MQSLQQQFLRRPEGNDALLAYQSGGIQGVLGGPNFAAASGSMQLPQQPRKFIDLGQHGSPNVPEQSHNRSQGVEQHMLNPIQQAYLQYAYQAAQQKSNLGNPSQQKPGIFGKDQEMRMANMKMQEMVSMQANQSQASSSRKSSDQVGQSDKQTDQSHRNEPKLNHPSLISQSAQMQVPQSQQNMMNNQIAMAAQMQAMQALALERNIDLSHPANANVVAQLIPLMQSRMVAQQKANENNTSVQSLPFAKQHVASPQIGNESSPHGNSSSDVSGQSGSSKARQVVSPSNLGVGSSASLPNNSTSIPMQQFSMQGRDNYLPPRQPALLAQGMPPTHPSQSSGNLNQGVDNSFGKSSATVSETSQAQNARQLNRSPSQSATPSNEVDVSNLTTSQGAPAPQMRQTHVGFTKQQLLVLKAQILAFRRLKVRHSPTCSEILHHIVSNLC